MSLFPFTRKADLTVEPPFTGNCIIREHTGDGSPVGQCFHSTYSGFCPRHGRVTDYPNNDDRDLRVEDRDFGTDPVLLHKLGRDQ